MATDEEKKSLLWYNFDKIIRPKVVRRHILKLKCTKFDFGWGRAPEPAGELTDPSWI